MENGEFEKLVIGLKTMNFNGEKMRFDNAHGIFSACSVVFLKELGMYVLGVGFIF